MDEQSDRLLTLSFLLGVIGLVSWVAFVLADDPRPWLAVAVVSTVGCAAVKLQTSIREVEARLTGHDDGSGATTEQ